MLIDLRGLRNPEHIRAFIAHFEGVCTIAERVDVILDDNEHDLNRFVMYLKACRAENISQKHENGSVMIVIEGPFSFCG